MVDENDKKIEKIFSKLEIDSKISEVGKEEILVRILNSVEHKSKYEIILKNPWKISFGIATVQSFIGLICFGEGYINFIYKVIGGI